MTTPTIAVNIRLTVEDYENVMELRREGFTQKEIFLTGLELLKDKIKIKLNDK